MVRKHTRYFQFSFILICSFLSSLAFAKTSLELESGEKRINLLELYTSEGCSSCPPADHWLSSLKNNKGLWKEFIPIAFHVDYWDYIGWKDRFAAPEYSVRQRIFARQQSLSTVYTPGMLLNGREWRDWYFGNSARFEKQETSGVLNIKVDGNSLAAQYTPKANKNAMKDMVLNVAILGFGLTSNVDAGENDGRKLEHDFVVLAHKMVQLNQSPNHYYINQTNLPEVKQADKKEAKQLAIVAWVNNKTDLSPIQAVGGIYRLPLEMQLRYAD